MFAIVKTGGKQYKVEKDATIKVEKIEGEDGKSIKLDTVLCLFDGKKTLIGDDAAKATVSAKIVEQTRGPKITIFKKKRRQNYRRKKGHRQDMTVLQITDIKAA